MNMENNEIVVVLTNYGTTTNNKARFASQIALA